MNVNMIELKRKIEDWLIEDMPYGDVSSDNIFGDETGEAKVIAKEDGVICGLFLGEIIYGLIDQRVTLDLKIKDGDQVAVGDQIGVIKGPHGSILKGERLFLNLLQRMSGIASMSNQYAKAVAGTKVRIVDTRKTTPGLRTLEKHAVVTGGCYNHRFSLSDAVMLKDNHIKAAGGITEAVSRVKAKLPHTMKIEVETETFDMVKEAVEVGCHIIMLDNMDNELMKKCVDYINEKDDNIIVEASGNMTIDRLKSVAGTGIDVISVGALTHSVKAMDISIKY